MFTTNTTIYSAIPAPFALFAFAFDLLFVSLLTLAACLVVSILLPTKKSPRQQFIFDLLNAESADDHSVEVLPVHKDHAFRRAA